MVESSLEIQKRLEQQLTFLREIEKCKLIKRKILCSDIQRAESVAEHSWHVAIFLLVFDVELPKNLDRIKMLKLALIHDCVEVYAGDAFAYDSKARENKCVREQLAAERLFAQLPPELAVEFKNLFDEFEKKETREAKIVHAFDKLQPILQNLCNEGTSWKQQNISYNQVDDYKRAIIESTCEFTPIILQAYESLLNDARRKGWLR